MSKCEECEAKEEKIKTAVAFCHDVIEAYERGIASWKEKEIAAKALYELGE